MALTATVGSASADTYATLAEFVTYAENVGWSLESTNAKNEQNLRRAAQWLDREFIWRGTRVNSTQVLEWPRVLDFYPHGVLTISSTEIPQAVKDAQCEIAYLMGEGTDVLAPITTIKRTENRVKPRIVAVEGLLEEYGHPRGSNVRLVRA